MKAIPEADHLNRFFGLLRADWLPLDGSLSPASASLASRSSRSRAMFSRIAIDLFFASSIAFAPSSAARRCRLILAICSGDRGSDCLAIYSPNLCAPDQLLQIDKHTYTAPQDLPLLTQTRSPQMLDVGTKAGSEEWPSSQF